MVPPQPWRFLRTSSSFPQHTGSSLNCAERRREGSWHRTDGGRELTPPLGRRLRTSSSRNPPPKSPSDVETIGTNDARPASQERRLRLTTQRPSRLKTGQPVSPRVYFEPRFQLRPRILALVDREPERHRQWHALARAPRFQPIPGRQDHLGGGDGDNSGSQRVASN
jgi:hypothetical protein